MTLFITAANESMYQKKGPNQVGHFLVAQDQIVLASGAMIRSVVDPNNMIQNSTHGIFGGSLLNESSSGTSLLLLGSVLSETSTGIYTAVDSYKVMIGVTGVVYGGANGILLSEHINGDGGNLVENRGVVQAEGATGIGISAQYSNNTISNLGSVFGFRGIVAGSAGSSNNHVINSGSIFTSGTGVELSGNNSSLTNSGLIRNTGAASLTVQLKSAAGETLSLLNTGTIEAQSAVISGGEGSDRITNQGTLKGNVFLDNGDNLYDGRGGTIKGNIILGSGNDTVYGGAIDGAVFLGDGNNLYDGRGGSIPSSILSGFGNDTAYGGAGNDEFSDDGGDNFLSGEDGDDYFFLSAGNHTVAGGAGSDYLVLSFMTVANAVIDLRSTAAQKIGAWGSLQLSGIENIASGDGNDLLIGTSADNWLSSDAGGDTLEGGLGNDLLDGGSDFDYARFTGSTGAKVDLNTLTAQNTGYGSDTFGSIEGLMGGSGADSFTGSSAANTFYGNAGNDSLSGGIGSDILYGGAGKDRLTGGADADTFVFDTTLNAKTNLDTITDFKAVDDTIKLENAIFKKLAKPGGLGSTSFVIGAKAKDSNDYIVYDKATGALSYDADGSGKGAAVKFAQLVKSTALTHDDFFIT